MTNMGAKMLLERYEQVKSLEESKNDLIEVNLSVPRCLLLLIAILSNVGPFTTGE
jgi:hypothetical protein